MSDFITVAVKGMTCDHCEKTVAEALERAGLEVESADWRRGEAKGRPTEGFTLDRAARELASTGYLLEDITGLEAPEATSADDHDYDLVVIGAGSAAFAAAITARDLGARVAIVERGTIGGTCVNIGCVPSKALLRPAELYWGAGHHPFRGIETSAGGVSLVDLVAQKDELVEELRQSKYVDLVDIYGFDVLPGEARFTDPGTIEVDGKPVTAAHYLVATGASPWVPPIPGLDETGYLTSTDALSLDELPRELIVVGANAIGLELGQLFLHLGSRVTFVEALDRIAPFEEPEISTVLHEHLESQGARVLASSVAVRAGRDGDRVWLELETGSGEIKVEADRLLMATGRRANTAALDLAAAGVETDRAGRVLVDDMLATSNPRIWAAGDVTPNPQFVYVAAAAGKIAAENALRSAGTKLDLRAMPRVTFTSPTIASVGKTEAEASEAGIPVMTSVLPLEAVPRALANRDTIGLIKLIADESSGELIGAHILAEGAGDVIQAAVMAITYRATVDEIAATFHPYLTMAEGLKLAAQGFTKDVKKLSCCAA
jgi:mercuric reductase